MKVRELKLGFNNCYLVRTGHEYVLIDTGYKSTWELFGKRLKEAAVGLSEISHLVLTHHHDDHSGLLNQVVQANRDIRIVMSDRAPALLAKGANDRTHRPCYVGRRVKLLIQT